MRTFDAYIAPLVLAPPVCCIVQAATLGPCSFTILQQQRLCSDAQRKHASRPSTVCVALAVPCLHHHMPASPAAPTAQQCINSRQQDQTKNTNADAQRGHGAIDRGGWGRRVAGPRVLYRWGLRFVLALPASSKLMHAVLSETVAVTASVAFSFPFLFFCIGGWAGHGGMAACAWVAGQLCAPHPSCVSMLWGKPVPGQRGQFAALWRCAARPHHSAAPCSCNPSPPHLAAGCVLGRPPCRPNSPPGAHSPHTSYAMPPCMLQVGRSATAHTPRMLCLRACCRWAVRPQRGGARPRQRHDPAVQDGPQPPGAPCVVFSFLSFRQCAPALEQALGSVRGRVVWGGARASSAASDGGVSGVGVWIGQRISLRN